MRNNKLLTVIYGPTCSGKTDFSVSKALKDGCDIFSCDSRQLYSELNIAVAKPSDQQLAAIPHHFINHISIQQAYNVGMYEQEAIEALDLYFKDHDKAILVGGTGLYMHAVISGLNQFPEVDATITQKLNEEWTMSGLEGLVEELRTKDTETYQNLDLTNPRRVLRALAIIRSTGKKFSSFKSPEKKKRSFDINPIYIKSERDILYNRINHRVDAMINSGLIEEAKSLYPFRSLQALDTVGYKELFAYFDATMTLEQAIDKIKQNTRNYAKRQMTWFNNYKF